MKNGKDKKEMMLEQLLEDNNLVRKQIPNTEGPNSLMVALSHALRFSDEYSNKLQHTCITHLKNLIKNGTLPPRLSKFHENETLWKQYIEDPALEEFEKTNLELISLVFQVKVLVYHVSEDNSMMTTVVNNKFEKLVELLRLHKNHFEPLFNKKDLEREEIFELSKEVRSPSREELNHISTKASSDDGGVKTQSSQRKLVFDQDTKVDSPTIQPPSQSNIIVQNAGIEISAAKRPKFLKKLTVSNNENDQSSKPTKIVENTVQAQNPAPIQESKLNSAQKKDTTIMRSAIKVSANTNETEKNPEIYSTESSLTKKKVFFDEAVTTAELKNLESHKVATFSQNEQMKSPIHFMNSPPPGITPTRYQTKTYGTDESKIVLQNRAIIPTCDKPNYVQALTQISSQDTDSLMSPGKILTDRIGEKMLSMKMNISEEPTQLIGTLNSGPLSSQKSPNLEAKKKQIVLEEGYERHTGKLKFFDENKNYGFIVMDNDGSDIFVHFDDLQKANLSKEILKTARFGNTIKLSFTCLKYIGKHDKSRKATDLQLIS